MWCPPPTRTSSASPPQALLGLAIGAIVVAISVLSTSSTTVAAAPWSAWQPIESGTAGAQEIADHIAPLYRISPVDQLSVMTVVGLANSGTSSATSSGGTSGSSTSSGLQVAVRPSASSSAVSLLTGKTVAFNLCGIGGTNCAIGVGTPTSARLLLLRREALELALYTFKYIGGVSKRRRDPPTGPHDHSRHTRQAERQISPLQADDKAPQRGAAVPPR